MGSGEEEDDGGLTPTEDEDDVQRPSGPPESVSALVNRGYDYLSTKERESKPRRAAFLTHFSNFGNTAKIFLSAMFISTKENFVYFWHV